MTATRYLTIFIVVLVNVNFKEVLGDEKSEEAQPNYEYTQIFKSIPALFEYLLNALEERPEILEKNDVTMFSRNIDISDTNDNETKMDKQDVDCEDPERQDEDIITNIKKRDAINDKSDLETTVAYEYGNSKIVMKDSDVPDSKEEFSKRAANSDSRKLNDEDSFEGKILKSIFKLDGDNLNEMLQYYGDAFLGFEYFFGLDMKPEEIEERILEAEKLLEEHNNKKDTGEKE